jgi:hypothetical protein
MRRVIVALVVSGLLLALAAPAAEARRRGAGTSVALGLASFAVFNQLVGSLVSPRPVYASTIYVSPPPRVIYAAPTVVVLPAPVAPIPGVVYYPHGRYELRGDGVSAAYQWVWIPNPPPPPPAEAPPAALPCKPTGRSVKTPQGVLPECE